MTAAVAPDLVEAPSPASTVTFISKTHNLRLVKKPTRRRQIGETGDWEKIPGIDFQFNEGRLVVEDAADIEWLRGHLNHGVLFHELGADPAASAAGDDTAEIGQRIMKLAFDLDRDAIADLLLEERQGLGRPTVIALCEQAIENIGDLNAPYGDDPAES